MNKIAVFVLIDNNYYPKCQGTIYLAISLREVVILSITTESDTGYGITISSRHNDE